MSAAAFTEAQRTRLLEAQQLFVGVASTLVTLDDHMVGLPSAVQGLVTVIAATVDAALEGVASVTDETDPFALQVPAGIRSEDPEHG